VEFVVGIVVAVVLFATYVTWVAGRIDRLQARVAAAHSALDAQLVRRSAVAAQLAERRQDQLGAQAVAVRDAAQACLAADRDQREAAENDLTRALHLLPLDPDDPMVTELAVVSRRLGVARQVHNDAVRDTLGLRSRRLPRALRLGVRHPLPGYFDIAELTVETAPTGDIANGRGQPTVGEATAGPA